MSAVPGHWDFVAAAYAIALALPAALAVSAMLRLRLARRRLAALDTRRAAR